MIQVLIAFNFDIVKLAAMIIPLTDESVGGK